MSAMGNPAQRAFTPGPVQRHINEGKHTVNELIARSAARGRHVVVEDAAHPWITMDRPDVVPQVINDLLGCSGYFGHLYRRDGGHATRR
jgi:hypothetical protein